MSTYKPDRAVVEACLQSIDPALNQEERLTAMEAATRRDPASAIGCLSGLLNGILDAIETRTHGLVTGVEIYQELACGIRERLYDQEP